MRTLFLVFLTCSLLPALAAEQVIAHTDRPTPMAVFFPDYPEGSAVKTMTPEAYIRANAARFGLADEGDRLVLERVQKSLLGTHYTYRQMYQGLPVDGADLVVSMLHEDNRIYQVYNHTWPEPASKTQRRADLELDREEALDMAWEHLRVHGRLSALPDAEKVWMVKDGHFRLVWRTQLVVDAPAGVWYQEVDAVTGKVLVTREVSQSRHPVKAEDYSAYEGPLTDRTSDTLRLEALEADRRAKRSAGKRAQGSGNTFDPDPLTTLNTDTLFDNSPASLFLDAYIEHDLLDITENGGVFSLVGPWVEITNFFPPNTAPSTTTNGVWDYTRGNNAFNDANTYFHLDQSQRFIQSLGYTGERGIQNTAIEVDTDGWNGIDNSRYVSNNSLTINRLEFGHGCVDDNEDADVILHEYGHAIHKWINPTWTLGSNSNDIGAIGEGFGDYWAGSYSYSTPNGQIYNPDLVYTWDGPNCWGGRFLNLTNLQYNPNITYQDHQSIPGGSSDELWSAPLFASTKTLHAMGYPLGDANAIVLESHFGIGSNPRMNALAQSTVNAAALLFPNGPHAEVFNTAFNNQNFGTTVPGGGGTTYTYLSAHVPPDNDWINEIQIVNASSNTASITATVYELSNGSYAVSDESTFTLTAGSATTFAPDGAAQRWVKFVSSQPLSGTSFFSRVVEGRGEEKAGIPLFKTNDTGTKLIIPHIPADRSFFSGAVVLNPNNAAATLSYAFYDAEGNALTDVQTADAPTALSPYQKWVGFLAPFEGLPSVFDDETGGAKVSYVEISSDQPLAAFELFGYKAVGNSPLATAGIQALPDNTETTYAVRATLTESVYTSFSILNPEATDADITAEIFDRDGGSLGVVETTIPARAKLLGLNINDPDNADLQFFRFPFPVALSDLTNPAEISAVVITGATNLRVFELTGSGTAELDGGAVTPMASKVVFPKPSGTVEIFKVSGNGNVTITGTLGEQVDTQTFTMSEHGLLTVELGNGSSAVLDTLSVTGPGIRVTQISRNATDNSIAVVNGSDAGQ